MANVWPGTLPQEPPEGISWKPVAGNVTESTVSAGDPKRRRRSTLRIMTASVSLQLLTAVQIDAFKDFFYSTLASGTDYFTYPDLNESGADDTKVYVDDWSYTNSIGGSTTSLRRYDLQMTLRRVETS